MKELPPEQPTQTLFNPHFHALCKDRGYLYAMSPYGLAVSSAAVEEDPRLPELEAVIFAHVVEHETHLYEARGYLAGPVVVKPYGARAIDLAKRPEPLAIPTFVEHEGLEIRRVSAQAILVVEDCMLFDILHRARAWRALDLVLLAGCGIPRTNARRLLHRLSVEFNKPVYVLADNDTWGYFIFSLLKRGLLAPNQSSPHFAVPDLRYLGLRAGVLERAGIAASDRSSRPWKPSWTLRLKCLRK